MDKKVLVTYASKYGATAEIAEKIGQVLCQAGLQADILPVKEVKDLTRYDAVILGSAAYVGQWRKEAAGFLQANETTLAQRPTWIFSTGPTGKGNPVELLKGWRLPLALQTVAERIHPRDVAVFHGNLDAKKLNFIEKQMIATVKAEYGDFRDWEAITAWAGTVADALKAAA